MSFISDAGLESNATQTYECVFEEEQRGQPANDKGTNPYFRFFDLEAQEQKQECATDMEYEFSNLNMDDEQDLFLFETGECDTNARARHREAPITAQDQEHDSLRDSYLLDELYCDSTAFCENADDPMLVLEDRHAILSWATAILSASPTARAMIFEAMDQGWSVSLEELNGPEYRLDVPEKLIVLDNNSLMISALGRSEYFRNAVLVGFIRALRDVWQEKRHGAFEEYDAESVLKLERVRAADLDIVATLVAWELRGEGVNGLWRHMIGSDEGDIAMRFSGYMEREPAAAFNGKALSEAFTQWFYNEERIRHADHQTLDAMDYAVEEYGQHAFGKKKVKTVNLEVLSCLPDKTAYLQGMGREIMMAPLYSGLNDAINQAHFFQIMHDRDITRVQDVPFRDAELAYKIFPNGEFTAEEL